MHCPWTYLILFFFEKDINGTYMSVSHPSPQSHISVHSYCLNLDSYIRKDFYVCCCCGKKLMVCGSVPCWRLVYSPTLILWLRLSNNHFHLFFCLISYCMSVHTIVFMLSVCLLGLVRVESICTILSVRWITFLFELIRSNLLSQALYFSIFI